MKAMRMKEPVKNKLDTSVLRVKNYEALFLSDIHFLVSSDIVANSHVALLELLSNFIERKINFRDIYLVGDIVENWYFSAREKLETSHHRLNKLFNLLDELWNREGSLYYIIGNHDTTSFNQGLGSWLRDYLEKRNWIVCNWYQNAHFIAIHGHQGQYGKFSWILNIIAVRSLYALARVIPGLFKFAERLYNRNLNHKRLPSKSQLDKYYARLSNVIHRRDRLMITGHTHEFLYLPKQKILNTGDWLESRTLVIQDKRTFSGYKLRDAKLTREFSCELETK